MAVTSGGVTQVAHYEYTPYGEFSTNGITVRHLLIGEGWDPKGRVLP